VTQYKLQKSILSLKSWLFTPATKSDKFSRAAEVHADALIIDLEDSVAPSAKREARETAFRYLAGFLPGHPAQVAIINAALTPSDQQIAKAREILVVNRKGVGTVDHRMVDEAVARKAKLVLERAGLID
jgi:(S)-citramalyl-CoA lyase